MHFGPGAACWQRIVQLLDEARESADICLFTIADDRISEGVLEAHRRDVKVRIITDDAKRFDDGSDISWLSKAEIPVVTDGPLALMHHKFAVIDRRVVLTGSYNWTRSAAKSNFEDLLIIRDAAVVNAYGQRFERLWTDLGAAMAAKAKREKASAGRTSSDRGTRGA